MHLCIILMYYAKGNKICTVTKTACNLLIVIYFQEHPIKLRSFIQFNFFNYRDFRIHRILLFFNTEIYKFDKTFCVGRPRRLRKSSFFVGASSSASKCRPNRSKIKFTRNEQEIVV